MSGPRWVFASMFVVACSASNENVTWDQSPPITERADAKPKTDAEIDALAATARSAATCEADAKRLYAEHAEGGWRMFRQCMTRDDFTDLLSLAEAPWKKRILDEAGALTDVMRVIVRRNSDDPSQDLRTIGFRIQPWPTGNVADLTTSGRVIFRGVADAKSDNQVAMEETKLYSGDTSGRVSYGYSRYGGFSARGAAAKARRTGTQLKVAPSGKCWFQVGSEYLIIGTFAPPKSKSLRSIGSTEDPVLACETSVLVSEHFGATRTEDTEP